MSDQSAIRLLQTAIANVRDECTDPNCKSLIATLNVADNEAERVLGEYGSAATGQPRNLRGAAALAKKQYAQARQTKADGDSDDK